MLNRFQLSLLTEGSGTQVFSTTFVQWAAREALRRAQPLTLVHALRAAAARESDERTARRTSTQAGSRPARFADRCRYGRVLYLAQSAASSRRGDSRRFSRGLRITTKRSPSRPARTGQTFRRADRIGRSYRADCMSGFVLPLLLFAARFGRRFVSGGSDGLAAGRPRSRRKPIWKRRARLAPRDGRVWVALSQTYWRLHKRCRGRRRRRAKRRRLRRRTPRCCRAWRFIIPKRIRR